MNSVSVFLRIIVLALFTSILNGQDIVAITQNPQNVSHSQIPPNKGSAYSVVKENQSKNPSQYDFQDIDRKQGRYFMGTEFRW